MKWSGGEGLEILVQDLKITHLRTVQIILTLKKNLYKAAGDVKG